MSQELLLVVFFFSESLLDIISERWYMLVVKLQLPTSQPVWRWCWKCNLCSQSCSYLSAYLRACVCVYQCVCVHWGWVGWRGDRERTMFKCLIFLKKIFPSNPFYFVSFFFLQVSRIVSNIRISNMLYRTWTAKPSRQMLWPPSGTLVLSDERDCTSCASKWLHKTAKSKQRTCIHYQDFSMTVFPVTL